MRRGYFQLQPGTTVVLVAGLFAIMSLGGCWKKSGEAMVLEKEYIAAREITPTPTPQSSARPAEPTPSPPEVVVEESKPLADDEVMVGSQVMKKDVRGTSRDPRASTDEQWIVRVQLVSDLRHLDVLTNKARWDKIKVGDKVKVSYRQGKYTGTVWYAELE
jgi:hypothetical protein